MTLIAAVGDDLPGRAAAEALAAEGVDARLTVDAGRPTGRCVVLVEPGGERSMLPDRGANEALRSDPLPPDATHLHVSGYALLRPASRPAARALLAAARAAGIGVSVDPASAAPLAAAGAAGLPGVDRRDRPAAAQSRGARRPHRRRPPRRCARRAHEVVVTLGAAGARCGRTERTLEVPAEAVDAIDTTGAGDAFAAGLLAARVTGAPPAAALAAGAALAAEAVARAGAR